MSHSSPLKKAILIEDYQAYYDYALTLHPGDVLTWHREDDLWPGWVWCTNADGVSAWVPRSILKRHGVHYLATEPYTSQELSAHLGDIVFLESYESGWYWCKTEGGRSGWIPSEKLKPTES